MARNVPPRLPLALASLLVLSAGCNPGFDPLSLLVGLRLIVVHGEPAEAAAGDQVTLSAVAIDTLGQPISYQWSSCNLTTPLSSTTTVNSDCITSPIQPPALTPLGSGPKVTVTVPALDSQLLSGADETLGVYRLVRISVRAPSVPAGGADRVVEGIYRLRLQTPLELACIGKDPALTSPAQAANHNPRLLGVWATPRGADGGTSDLGPLPHLDAGLSGDAVELLEGAPLTVDFNQPVALRALFADDAFEKYCGVDSKASPPTAVRTEIPTVRWLATDGELSEEITGQESSTTFTLRRKKPEQASGTLIDLYAVGRDERGGNSWLHRTLRIR